MGSAAEVGTQNMEAMTPSVVGPTVEGGPQEGCSSASSTHCSDAPNGRPGLMPGVCVCVCVCVRERESVSVSKERERERESACEGSVHPDSKPYP